MSLSHSLGRTAVWGPTGHNTTSTFASCHRSNIILQIPSRFVFHCQVSSWVFLGRSQSPIFRTEGTTGSPALMISPFWYESASSVNSSLVIFRISEKSGGVNSLTSKPAAWSFEAASWSALKTGGWGVKPLLRMMPTTGFLGEVPSS